MDLTAPPSRAAEPGVLHATPSKRQFLQAGVPLPRHVHSGPYIAVVVEGGYVEANEAGRRELRAGDVAVHGPFSAHCNHVSRSGAVVLNLAVEGPWVDSFGCISDIDALVRLAERDSHEAGLLALSRARTVRPTMADWPDQLALDIASNPQLCLSDWARQHGLALETVSRGFRRVYGATPKRVRFEQRAKHALLALLREKTPLSQLSLDAGFADQSSMTHAIRALTGTSPLALRHKSTGDKTGPR